MEENRGDSRVERYVRGYIRILESCKIPFGIIVCYQRSLFLSSLYVQSVRESRHRLRTCFVYYLELDFLIADVEDRRHETVAVDLPIFVELIGKQFHAILIQSLNREAGPAV